jgi:predicted regulator of Ras-like GTPase activity (Roadblock/LC7/MglB family)
MKELFSEALDRLSRVPGVSGALIVDAQGGIPVAVSSAQGLDGNAVAALATALFSRLARASGAATFGGLRTAHFEGTAGHLLVAPAGNLLVVVVADAEAQLGMLRIEARRVAEVLQ